MSFGVWYDSTLSLSEETRFVSKNTNLFKAISKEYNCPLVLTTRLGVIYYKFQINNKDRSKGMRKSQLMDFLHNSLNMTDKAMNYYVASVMDHKRNPTTIFYLDSWLRAMIMFIKGSISDKIQHCFKIYDRFQQRKISRANINFFLADAIYGETREEVEDAFRDFVEIIIKKIDVDCDGTITKKDYNDYCLRQPLGLEFLGQCWPSREALLTFCSTFNLNVRNLK